MSLENPNLYYIDTTHMKSPIGELTGFEVRDAGDRKLGRLDGFVLDPHARQVRYLVVLRGGWLRRHRYLLPLRTARIEREKHAVLLELEDGSVRVSQEFDSEQFPDYSNEHLLAALFESRDAA